MLLDSELFTSECNGFGVGYTAFQSQPGSCAVAQSGTCTQQQLADYFDADWAKVRACK